MSKARRLRELICGPGTGVLVEAHNGLTAKLVQEAGFDAVWASGLALSASMGVRDNNELSPSEVMQLLEFMADCTQVPILLDGDTGYGNFNNLRRLVVKLEQRGVAGVCIEDKLFPKTNSFIAGEEQPLADVDEFCGKLRAGKDAQRDPHTVIVARTEALIAGWSLDAALERASRYAEAGADAVLVHSKSTSADQIRAFMQHWDGRAPVVVVPTTYAETSFLEFERLGVGAVIYANHVLRTIVSAVQDQLRQLARTRDLGALDRRIAPVSEIFRLQDVAEMKAAERRYLPARGRDVVATVLAASQGSNFGSLTDDKPKCMIPVWGRPILSHIVATFNEVGIKDVAAVVGYRSDAVDVPNVARIENSEHAATGSLVSLQQASDRLRGECVVSYGDVLYETSVLAQLLDTPGDLVLVVDVSWCQGDKLGREIDGVVAAEPPSQRFRGTRVSSLREIGPAVGRERAHGEWIGLLRATEAGARRLSEALARFAAEDPERFRRAGLTDLFGRMLAEGEVVQVLYVTGQWFDVDSIEDLSEAYPGRSELAGPTPAAAPDRRPPRPAPRIVVHGRGPE